VLVGEDAYEGDEDDAERGLEEEGKTISFSPTVHVEREWDEPQPKIDPSEGHESSVNFNAA